MGATTPVCVVRSSKS